MKTKMLSLITAISVAGAFSAYGATSTEQKVEKLSKETKQLKKELASLKSQLATKSDKKAQATSSKTEGSAYEGQIGKLLNAARYTHGLSVVSSPFLGDYDAASNAALIVNFPSQNTDMHFLEQRQRMESHAIQKGEPLPNSPLIDISGAIAGQFVYNKDYAKKNNHHTDFKLSRAEIDVLAEVNPWVTGAVIFGFDDNPPHLFNTSVDNSRFKIDRAFITAGNLNKTPVYMTVGQVFVPFGNFSTARISDPLTKVLGQTKARAVTVGFDHNHKLYGSIYGFKGDSFVNNDHNINQGGVNIGYKTNFIGGLITDFGVGYILNIADSNLMHNFNGFPCNQDANHHGHKWFQHLERRVPAFNAHASLNVKPVTILTEYVGATKKFHEHDMSFNHNGAEPKAMSVEGVYHFDIANNSMNFGIGYDQTWDSLALGLPKESYIAFLSTAFWKYTTQSLEYKHNVNYHYGDIASAKHEHTHVSHENSRTNNTLTMEFGVYF